MKKGYLKSALVLFLSAVAVIALAGCRPGGNETGPYQYTSDAQLNLNQSGTAHSFVTSSFAERKEILAQLERWALENSLLGITLFANNASVLVHPDITLPVQAAIPGFGFGIIAEGSVDADLMTQGNPAWRRYYHLWDTNDPNHINGMASQCRNG